jgi:2-polyprenyl-6-methoxyphenol hydroxylase-like FAD-dependent oxidoreductase
VLAELGLAPSVLAMGRKIDRLFGRTVPSNRIILDVRYDHLGSDYFGLAVHRAALFSPLFEAATQRGIPIETGIDIVGCDSAGRPALLAADGKRIGPFDLVVDSMGVRSPLASHYANTKRNELVYGALWTNVPWPKGRFNESALEQRYEKASVMIGVLPVGRRHANDTEQTAFFWSIKPTDYDAWQRAGLSAWEDRALRLWPQTQPLLDAIIDCEQMTLARYCHHTIAKPAAGRVVAIGDSAHAASPQLGQGANMALLDARALSLALDHSRSLDVALKRYMTFRRWHVRFYQILSALFTPFYQSDNRWLPPLRDFVVAPVTRLPLFRAFVAGTVAGVLLDPRKKLRLHR